MLTYPKSIMRVRRMPMHLSSGHVTLFYDFLFLLSNYLLIVYASNVVVKLFEFHMILLNYALTAI